MNALSLFSGIGGIDLACEWANIKTVAFCEREPFPQKVLRKHWPDVPIYDDVCTLTKERLDADGILKRSISLISAGYPCQPYSVAGEREGEEDDRALWPEVKRLLEQIRPRWFVGENVAGHISLGIDSVLSDLDNLGYSAQPIVIPAVAVGALHRRDRVFIVAHSPGELSSEPRRSRKWWSKFGDGSFLAGYRHGSDYWKIEPELGRVVDGISPGLDERNRRDRLKAIGNAVVPQQIYPILAAIKQIDELIQEDS